MKKREKSTRKLELPINGNTKTIKYKPCLSFLVSQKKIVEFAGWTHTIYGPAKIA